MGGQLKLQEDMQKLFSKAICLAVISYLPISKVCADEMAPTEGITSDTAATAAPTTDIPTITPGKQPLQGGVQHSEQLQSVDQSLMPGKVYSDDALLQGNVSGNDLWYQIPTWYAGTRHADYVTIVYRHFFDGDLTSSPMQRQLERQDTTSGYMKDKKGGIWEFSHTPGIHHVESDNQDAVLWVKKITPLQMTDDQFVIKYQEISINYTKRSKRIINVVQQEQINAVTCPRPGLLRLDTSVRSYDSEGQPEREEQSVGFIKITKPFQERDTFEGRDLKPLFKEFLLLKGLGDLVPDNLK